MTTPEQMPAPSASAPESVWRMFDRIAPRYDLLNRVLSGRRDVAWRRRMGTFLRDRRDLRLLDLATGTGDQIFHLIDAGTPIAAAVGIDMSEAMLARGREKVLQRGLAGRVELQVGDATQIPFPDASFDVVTITFGIRNVGDVPRALRDMRRILRPGGRALILEFSLPTGALSRACYVFYLRHLLPWIGGMVSGDSAAYRYLNRTIEAFPCGEAFCDLMRAAGFAEVTANPLTLGVATIYKGDVPLAADPASRSIQLSQSQS